MVLYCFGCLAQFWGRFERLSILRNKHIFHRKPDDAVKGRLESVEMNYCARIF